MEQFGAAGARDSSSAQLGLADYLSQVQLNEGDIMSQMYMQSYNNYMNQILGLAGPMEQYQQSRPTTWDIISGILGDVTGGVTSGLFGGIKKLFGGGGGSTTPVDMTGSYAGPGLFSSTTPSSLAGAESGFGTGWLPTVG